MAMLMRLWGSSPAPGVPTTHTVTQSLTHTVTQSLTHTHTQSLTHTHTQSHSHTHTHTAGVSFLATFEFSAQCLPLNSSEREPGAEGCAAPT
jgi:hypothetical protein